jgi:hypothetical protein
LTKLLGGDYQMKKVLALLLVFAMVCGAFIPAFAATDAELAAEAQLQELGILNDDRADDSLTRAEMVVLLSRMLGEEAAAKDFPVAPSFADATDHWAANYIAWAESMAYVNGIEKPAESGIFVFEPDSVVTLQQYQAVLLRALGYEVAYADVPAKALELGLVVTAADPMNLKRGETSILTVAALETEMADGSQTLAAKLGMVADLAIVSAEQTDEDQFTVTFNQAVTEGTFSVMRGKVATAVEEVEFDGTVATLTMERTIRDGFDYTIEISGIEAIVAGQDSEVSAINFLYDYANLKAYDESQIAVVYYEIVDQFGNDVTKANYGETTFYSIGDVTKTEGSIEVETSSQWLLGTPMIVNAVYNDGAGIIVTATQTFEISGPIKLSELALGAPVNIGDEDDDQEIMAGKEDSDDYKWVLPVTALNQYGDAVADAYAIANLQLNESNLEGVSFDLDEDDNLVAVVDLEDDESENVSAFVTVVDINSGLNDSVFFDVPKAGVADFKVLGPVDEVIGDEDAAFEFEAYDAYGNEITDFDDLTDAASDVTYSGSDTIGTSEAGDDSWYYSENALTGEVTLNFVAPSNEETYATPKYFTFQINNKVSQVSFSVNSNRKTVGVVGLDEDTDVLFVVDTAEGTASVASDGLVYVDQYGKETNESTFPVDFAWDTTSAGTASIDLSTAASTDYTVTVLDGDDTVDEFEFTVEVYDQDEVDEVTVSELGTLYATTSDAQVSLYEKDVELTGIVDGKEVVMPSDITIGLQVLGGNLATGGVATAPTVYAMDWAVDPELEEDETYTRTVLTTFTFDGMKTLVQEVTVDTTLPAAESIVADYDDDVDGVELDGNVLSITVDEFEALTNLFDTDAAFFFELENQYGVHDVADVSYIYYTVEEGTPTISIDNSGETVGNITADVDSDDEIMITAVTDSGLTVTVTVEIK